MKIAAILFLTLLFNVFVVLGAKQAKPQAGCLADPGLEMFCTESASDLSKLFDDIIATTPNKRPQPAVHGAANRQDSRDLVTRGIYDDIKNYFKIYWSNIKLIAQGHFGEGIFNQLKNAGSWCDKDDWYVKAIKKALAAATLGKFNIICDCLYPVIKVADTYDSLVCKVNTKVLDDAIKGCGKNTSEQIQKVLEEQLNDWNAESGKACKKQKKPKKH